MDQDLKSKDQGESAHHEISKSGIYFSSTLHRQNSISCWPLIKNYKSRWEKLRITICRRMIQTAREFFNCWVNTSILYHLSLPWTYQVPGLCSWKAARLLWRLYHRSIYIHCPFSTWGVGAGLPLRVIWKGAAWLAGGKGAVFNFFEVVLGGCSSSSSSESWRPYLEKWET